MNEGYTENFCDNKVKKTFMKKPFSYLYKLYDVHTGQPTKDYLNLPASSEGCCTSVDEWFPPHIPRFQVRDFLLL